MTLAATAAAEHSNIISRQFPMLLPFRRMQWTATIRKLSKIPGHARDRPHLFVPFYMSHRSNCYNFFLFACAHRAGTPPYAMARLCNCWCWWMAQHSCDIGFNGLFSLDDDIFYVRPPIWRVHCPYIVIVWEIAFGTGPLCPSRRLRYRPNARMMSWSAGGQCVYKTHMAFRGHANPLHARLSIYTCGNPASI